MLLYHNYVIINIGDDMEALHIITEKENIAPLVLLPGDPLRAKYIAENFLTDVQLVNELRNMLAFTGYYKGHRITVMGSGMGCASAALYAYELYEFFDVKKIIRIGTSGTNKIDIKLLDTVLSTGSYSESSIAYHWGGYQDKYIDSSQSLNKVILDTAQELNLTIKCGPTLTSDVFDPYINIDHILDKCPIKDDLVCIEMEGFGLMHAARMCNKEFAMLATVVDSKFTPDIKVSPEERQNSLNTMITLALEAIIK